jgi:3D (Asp-Asp-Asp) domain-containing protein
MKNIIFILLFLSCCTYFKEEYKNYNDFTITAYCPNSCCNDQYAGLTASGKTIKYYKTKHYNICAVDPKVIPLYSIIEWDGKEYLAVDVGGKIKKHKIDILLDTHDETIVFGVKENQVIRVIRIGKGV